MNRKSFDTDSWSWPGDDAQRPKLGFLNSINPVLLGGIGSIVGGIAQRIAIGRMNRYNSPESGADRMRRAGLPLAAMNEQSAGNQSAIPGEGFTGAGEHLSHYIQGQQDQAALLRSKNMLRGEIADSDLKVFDRNAYLSPYIDENNKLTTLREGQISYGVKAQKANAFIAEHQADITGLQLKAQQELDTRGMLTSETRARIGLMLVQAKLAGAGIKFTQANTEQIDSASKGVESLIKRFEADGNINLLESAMLIFLQQGRASAGGGNFNIGF